MYLESRFLLIYCNGRSTSNFLTQFYLYFGTDEGLIYSEVSGEN
jgi:hypothetical protein